MLRYDVFACTALLGLPSVTSCNHTGVGTTIIGNGLEEGTIGVKSSGGRGSVGASDGGFGGSIEEKSSGDRGASWFLTLGDEILCFTVWSCCSSGCCDWS